MRMKACINVLGQIYVSEYFDMGLLLKALEITLATPMGIQCILALDTWFLAKHVPVKYSMSFHITVKQNQSK